MLIEVFKTGTHTDSNGNTRIWSEKDLDAIIAKYNPAEHEAPVVIGHPKDNSPAYGWVEKLERNGNVLYATFKDLADGFKDWVEKGLYKKRSISLYPDMTLRHVGFLGAVPPAVKGLADVQFKEDKTSATYEFSDYHISAIGNIFQRLREWIIEKFGTDAADKVISSYDIDSLKTEPPVTEARAFAEDAKRPEESEREKAKEAQEARAKQYNIGVKEGGNVTKPSKYESLDDSQFADPVNYRYPIDEEHCEAALSYWGMPKNREQYTEEEVGKITKKILDAAKKHGIEIDEEKWKFLEKEDDMDKIKELEDKLKEAKDQLANFSEGSKTKDSEIANLKSKISSLDAEKRKAEHQSFCEGLEREGKLTPAMKPTALDFMEILSGQGEYEFAEADDKKVKKAPLEAFKAFLTGLPKQVEFSEHATKNKAGAAGGVTEQREKAVSDFMEKNPKASYKEAVIEVSKKNPELFEREG